MHTDLSVGARGHLVRLEEPCGTG